MRVKFYVSIIIVTNITIRVGGGQGKKFFKFAFKFWPSASFVSIPPIIKKVKAKVYKVVTETVTAHCSSPANTRENDVGSTHNGKGCH